MPLHPYPCDVEEDLSVFQFISEGLRGPVPKQITFVPTGNAVYNLRLHDLDEDDPAGLNRTGNGDAQRVIDTVIAAIAQFAAAFPQRWVMFYSGDPQHFDAVRMRLYRRGMRPHLSYIRERVTAFGVRPDNGYEPYNPDPAHEYVALLFRPLPVAAEAVPRA